MLEEIDAVNWGDLPGPRDLYEPDRVATGLRALATTKGLVQAAGAGSLLAGGGLVHNHSGAVFPAAVTAAPILLAIVRDGHPEAGATALGLLDDALTFAVCDRRTRVATAYAEAVPLCCALADHLRRHAGLLAASGAEGRRLLADAAHHWRFDVQEAVAEGDGAAAFGVLAGRFPGGTQPAELHRAGHVTPLAVQVAPHYPLSSHSPDACLRMDGARLDEVSPPAVLFPGRCGSGSADR
ncbi:hypothetical protein ACF1BR_05325 [Streptomyces rubiginosohelvolus]|uniref:hypothetical protein n=1 Tax=Streptomyces rubiginosohelvolus TaxID=67362 RepID=UPI0036F60455